LKRAIAEFSEDPARADLIKQLSVRRTDASEPAFPEESERIELLIVGPTGSYTPSVFHIAFCRKHFYFNF
jgi:hypothetical protein